MSERPRFVCCYQGLSDYTWKGQRYEVRSSADDYRPGVWNYTPEEYARERVATVGTIMRSHDRQGDFPPEELEQFFPGYVRARFRADWSVEYAGAPPQTVHSAIYQWVVALAYAREMEQYGQAIN